MSHLILELVVLLYSNCPYETRIIASTKNTNRLRSHGPKVSGTKW